MLPHSSDTSQATLYPITSQDACQLYWLLSSLDVSYAYSVNGSQISRNFSAESTMIPKNRLIVPPTLYTSGYDSATQTSYAMNLYMGNVYFDAADNSKIGFKLTVEETDGFNLINLRLNPIPGMGSVSRTFTFIGKTLTAYLNYNQSSVASAELASFSLTPQFFTI
ncbi:MAG: hypothetical protein LBI61_01930 [Puniceicoccales bacterium]|nr:hypothetical protein [Puniceicoccales bacterium]